MKNLLFLLTITLTIRVAAFAQEKSNSYTDYAQKNATFIIEGKIVDVKRTVLGTPSPITNGGIFYTLIQVRPTGTFKGTTDNSIIYEFLIESGTYINSQEFGLLITPDHHQADVPQYGVFFLTKETQSPDFSEPFQNAMHTKFIFGMDYSKTKRDNVLKELSIKFNLKFTEFEKHTVKKYETKSSFIAENNADENKEKYQQQQNNYNNYMQHLQAKVKNKNGSQNKSAGNPCKEFFISEYIDGPQKNKVIEIYNPSDSIKSLNNYSIKVFQNGAPTPLDIPLSGNVNPKETYVVTHPQADANILSKANQMDVKLNFDGNDAIVLNKGQSTYIDKIGEIGVNPGQSGWSVPPSGSTKAQDLRRKYPIDEGETDWNNGKNQWNTFPPDSSENIKQHNNACSPAASSDLTFSFANPTESGTSPKFFEFDVMVSANTSTTFFDNCLLRIQYNTGAFGSDLVANNKVTITKGATYNSVTYIDPDANAIDQTNSVLGVPFGTDFNQSSWNRTLVTTTPTQILHSKIEIQNCGQFSGIDFTDITFTPIFSFYTTNATEPITGNSFSYDNTIYGTGLNEELCPFKITTFSSPVYAGAYYPGNPVNLALLTINGNGFGSTKGNGNVYFKNADDGGQTYVTLNAYDYISWSDNEIKITLPAIIDSLYVPKYPTPGGGIFYVKTNAGDSTFSLSPVDIPYAISNTIRPLAPPLYEKIRIDVANVNDSGGYTFRLDTSITNYPDPMLVPAIKKAVKEWVCATGINFTVGADTTISVSNPDGVSVIYFSNTPPVINALAATRTQIVICGNFDNTGKYVIPLDIDIAVLKDPTLFGSGAWFIDTLYNALPTNKNDFYEVMLHELGHADLLSHNTDNSQLMYYKANLGPVAGNARRFITFDDQEGGLEVVDKSALNNYSVSCNVDGALIIVVQNCTFGNNITDLNPNVISFSLFPNPIGNNQLTISYEIQKQAPVLFKIIDNIGREHFTMKENKTAGKYQEQINLNNLSQGIYFFVVDIDGTTQSTKIVKVK